MPEFELHSQYTPKGDQPEAIEELSSGIKQGMREQTLLGVTGSGKTFTMANVIEEYLENEEENEYLVEGEDFQEFEEIDADAYGFD